MRALSIRQPYAELILRGIKTVELRSRATTIVGERFYIYASKKWAVDSGHWAGKAWSEDLSAAPPPLWMIELAEQVKMIEPGALLPMGVIVGTAVVEKCERIEDGGLKMEGPSSILDPPSSLFKWHLTDVQRAEKFRKPTRHPQPVWFRPF
jgi:hypothetical protein